MVITGGQRNDGVMLAHVLAEIHVPRLGPGRPRTRPDAVIADRAYTSGVTRAELRRRAIRAVIPEKSDQIAGRKRRGRRGGRPPGFDADAYRGRNVVERSFALAKQWRGLATGTTSSRSPIAPPSPSAPSSPGYAIWETRPNTPESGPSSQLRTDYEVSWPGFDTRAALATQPSVCSEDRVRAFAEIVPSLYEDQAGWTHGLSRVHPRN